MRYYLLYQDETGLIVGFLTSPNPVDSSWTEVTREEYVAAGGVVPIIPPDPIELVQKDNTLLRAELSLANAQIEMLNDCLAEVAAMVYP